MVLPSRSFLTLKNLFNSDFFKSRSLSASPPFDGIRNRTHCGENCCGQNCCLINWTELPFVQVPVERSLRTKWDWERLSKVLVLPSFWLAKRRSTKCWSFARHHSNHN